MGKDGMVIVGAGEAGSRAAVALRENGWTGRITLIGSEKHLPYERPPLSKQFLTEDGEPVPANILNENLINENNIELLVGRTVASFDREKHVVLLSDGSELKFERMLLSTGAVPRELTLPGSGTSKVLYLRTIKDSWRIRQQLKPGRHVAIIGGGFIGLEVAASAIKKGCDVTLVEAAPRILMRGVPEEIAQMVEALHRSNGVRFQIGVPIREIHHDDNDFTISLENGQSIVCDAVIAGIGAIPETSIAKANGLEIDNGICVNEHLMTSDSDIFAAGDCCSFPHPLYGGRRVRLEAWRNAQDQGIHAARNMLETPLPYNAIPWFWSDQYEQTLQVAGLTDGYPIKIVRDLGRNGKMYFHLSRAYILKAVSCIGSFPGLSKEMRLAEMLIEKQATLQPEYISNPSNSLKKLLRA